MSYQMKQYSVLLYVDAGEENLPTYYGWVSALSPKHAVMVCQIDCYLADYENGRIPEEYVYPFDPEGWYTSPLLIIEGHHEKLWFNFTD